MLAKVAGINWPGIVGTIGGSMAGAMQGIGVISAILCEGRGPKSGVEMALLVRLGREDFVRKHKKN
jgi:hypothetical protein